MLREASLKAGFSLLIVALFLTINTFASDKKSADVMTSLQRDEALRMLKDVDDKVTKEYYDLNYHGLNLGARYQEAEQRIAKAQSLSEAFGVIAWFLDILNDSHTFFVPPSRPFLVEDGWEAGFIGEKCMIIAVKDGSDAASKGVKPGDELVLIEGFRPTRSNWWKLDYAFHSLSPRSGMKLGLLSPDGKSKEVTVMSSVHELPKTYNFANGFDVWNVIRQSENDEERNKPRMVEEGDVLVWKLPRFMVSDDQIDAFLHKANHHAAVVIDLRGNPGGAEENLSRLLGGIFDHEVKVADRAERKNSKPFVAKSRGSHSFSGKVFVLVDSRSASAAELFARVVQLEKRGVVIGDRSAGAVMESREFPLSQGSAFGTDMPYGVSVTVADLKMADGNSLEHRGVVPDELLLPTSEELAAGADPQMARALQLAGISVSSAAAGQLFPIRWK